MQWAKFHNLVDDTVARLKTANGDRDGIEDAIRRYLERGEKLGMSPYDLADYFAISSPGIPEKAGYCGVECEKLVDVFQRMTRERLKT